MTELAYDHCISLSYVLDRAKYERDILASVRSVPHIEFRHPVTVIRPGQHDERAVTYDISEDGMGLFAPFRCDLRERLVIRIDFRDGKPAELPAVVTRICKLARGLWEIGCVFS